MVTIIDFQKRKNSKDEEFNVLIHQGDIGVVFLKESGKPWFTARKTSVPCTFDESISKTLRMKAEYTLAWFFDALLRPHKIWA